MDEMFNNLKAQVQVLAPDLDLSLFSQDNIVVDGKIVPTPDDAEEPQPDSKFQGSRPPQSPEVQVEVTNVTTPSSPPSPIPAVLVSMHPPTPSVRSKDVQTGEDLNTLLGETSYILFSFVWFLGMTWLVGLITLYFL
ncbi:uncharacterized protein DS421_18g619490 [Arachis hypogaea]|nr:uncharacterized protein DS421_18g619490 [Arachis hypogaea]